MLTGSQKILTNLGDAFHVRLGQCMAEWARVDEELFQIFRWCVGPYKQSAIIYYKTPSLEARRSLTDELVTSVLPKQESGEHPHAAVRTWRELVTRIQNGQETRRRIAHAPAQLAAGDPMPAGSPPRETGFQIVESLAEQDRGKSAKPPLGIDDLTAHIHAVANVANELHLFRFYELPNHVGEPPWTLPPPRTG